MTSAYCVYDKKAKRYSAPQFLENDEVAYRMFVMTFKSSDLFQSFPEDYDLMYIGDFDDETGQFLNAGEYDLEPMHVVVAALDLSKGESSNDN